MAVELYHSALAPSTKKTYKTGAKHLRNFLSRYPGLPQVPFPRQPVSIGTLTLCFFAASLFLRDTIKSAQTVRCYISHAKNYCINLGCDPTSLDSEELARVLRGISRALPKIADTRPPFLLPHYKLPLGFRYPVTTEDCRKIASIVFGFFGMLRFHVYKKLHLNSLVLVSIWGKEWKLRLVPPSSRRNLLFSENVLGFYFDVSDKYHPVARVYLPKIGDLNPTWLPFCPLRALRRLWAHGLLTPTTFSDQVFTESEVVSAMKFIDSNNRDFQTQSLRIGGHTFFISHGMPEDFVNFLGRRKIKKASQLYYRGSARLTLALFRYLTRKVKLLV